MITAEDREVFDNLLVYCRKNCWFIRGEIKELSRDMAFIDELLIKPYFELTVSRVTPRLLDKFQCGYEGYRVILKPSTTYGFSVSRYWFSDSATSYTAAIRDNYYATNPGRILFHTTS